MSIDEFLELVSRERYSRTAFDDGRVLEMYRIATCRDCTLIIANGETDGPDEFDYDAWNAGVESNWPTADGWQLGLGWRSPDHESDGHGDEECECAESWFSWSSCEGCGSGFGGDREYNHASRTLLPDGTPQR